MKFQDVLLSPNGRISRQPYWIATVVMIVAGVVAGQTGANKYGPDPLNPVDEEVFQ